MDSIPEEEKQMRQVWVSLGSYHELVAKSGGMGLASDGVLIVMGVIAFSAPNQGLDLQFVVAPPNWS